MENNRNSVLSDVIILGAGINGCGIAAELSRSGYTVTVLEKNTVGSGTSSKSSRLIHGGLRYLETFEFGLVHEALKDRQILLEKFPEIVKIRPFYLPVYKSSPRPAWMIWCGLKLYDLLSGGRDPHKSRIVKREDFQSIAPHLRQSNLTAVFRYFDAKTNDLKLTQSVADEAQKQGAALHQFIRIETIVNAKSVYRVFTNRGMFSAPVLINATGPWIDEVNAEFDLPAKYHIRKISGIHVILDGLMTRDLMFMQTKEKRIFFIIPEPEHNQTIIGTTEREETVPIESVKVNPEDVDYLLNQLNSYLNDESQVTVDDIKSSYIGVRPLIAHKDNPVNLSREYELDLHKIGETKLLHVFGGKLTTYLSLAQKVRKQLEN